MHTIQSIHSGQTFGLPLEVVGIIVGQLQPHLHALVRTNKVLNELCKMPMEDSKLRFHALGARISKLRVTTWDPAHSPVAGFQQDLEALPAFAAGQRLLEIAQKILKHRLEGEAAKGAVLTLMRLAWQVPPKAMAQVLAAVSEDRFKQTLEDLSEEMTSALQLLKESSAEWHGALLTVQEARALTGIDAEKNFENWHAWLQDRVKAKTLSTFEAAEVLKAGAILSWGLELKPYWFALILATPDPAHTCRLFAEGLVKNVGSRAYLQALEAEPNTLRNMCTSLVDCCKPQGSQKTVEVLETYGGTVARIWDDHVQKTHVFLAIHEQAVMMDEESQGILGARLIALLREPAAVEMTLVSEVRQRLEDVLRMFCKQAAPDLESIRKGIHFAGILEQKLAASLTGQLLAKAANRYPGTEVWQMVCDLLVPAPREVVPILVTQLLKNSSSPVDKKSFLSVLESIGKASRKRRGDLLLQLAKKIELLNPEDRALGARQLRKEAGRISDSCEKSIDEVLKAHGL